MNQYVILYDMLMNPLERFCANDYIQVFQTENMYVMASFRVLEKKGLIECIGVFGKEKMYEISSDKFLESAEYLFNKAMKYFIINKINISYITFISCFSDLFNYDEVELLGKRIDNIEKQLVHYPNDAVLINILNKYFERKKIISM